MRLGIFGGSFDPVHLGHLELARSCQRLAGLDEVWFTPTAVQPLKQTGPHATDAQRIDMLELAIATEPSWRVCKLEIERGGLSYTVDTMRQLSVELPSATLFFLLGADAVRDVPHWREPEEIFRLATPLVVHRGGQPKPDLSVLSQFGPPSKQPLVIEMPAVDISSTEIRRRVAAGESIAGLVPSTVAAYIAGKNVYAANHPRDQ